MKPKFQKIDYERFTEKQKVYKEKNKSNPGRFMYISGWPQKDDSITFKLNTVDENGDYTTLFEGKMWMNQDRTSESQPGFRGNTFNKKDMDKLRKECIEGESKNDDDDLPF